MSFVADVPDDQHGLASTYDIRWCRCDLCTEAHRSRYADRKRPAKTQIVCGTLTAYRHHRNVKQERPCKACREAWAQYRRELRTRGDSA